jgi:hypothetical protein
MSLTPTDRRALLRAAVRFSALIVTLMLAGRWQEARNGFWLVRGVVVLVQIAAWIMPGISQLP